MSDPPPPHGQLVTWLKANVLTGIALAISILGSSGMVVWAGSRWVATYENQVNWNKDDIAKAASLIRVLQADMKSVDGRLVEQASRVTELHNQSDAADATIRARLDVIEALSRYAADRATQAALPTPGGRR